MVSLKGEALSSPMSSEGNGEKGNQLENDPHAWPLFFSSIRNLLLVFISNSEVIKNALHPETESGESSQNEKALVPPSSCLFGVPSLILSSIF